MILPTTAKLGMVSKALISSKFKRLGKYDRCTQTTVLKRDRETAEKVAKENLEKSVWDLNIEIRRPEQLQVAIKAYRRSFILFLSMDPDAILLMNQLLP